MRKESKPYAHLYRSVQWRMLRVRQLTEHPLCHRCLTVYNRVASASVVHHVEPHKGNAKAFFNAPLMSLCKHCHDSDMQEQEKSGAIHVVGIDGWSVPRK